MDFRISECGCRISKFCQSTLTNKQLAGISNSNSEIRISALSLRELEAFAGTLLPILLTLFDARIARHQAGLLQRRTQVSIVFEQCSGNAVANGARLSRRSASANIDQNIKLGDCFGQL